MVPLTTAFEYAVLVVDGPVRVEQQSADRGEMVYLGQGRESFGLSGPGRVLLLGGEPFAEEIVMVELHRPQPRRDRCRPQRVDGGSVRWH